MLLVPATLRGPASCPVTRVGLPRVRTDIAVVHFRDRVTVQEARVKPILLLMLLLAPVALSAQKTTPPTTLRGLLLEQLRTTHNNEDWFVPANIAVAGLTAEQAKWSPGNGQHSVGQLAYHLWYWDSRALTEFKGEKPPAFDGNNDETFNNFDAAQWGDLVKKLDQVMTDWEKAVESADEKKLADNASLIAHIGAHNAYHIGQILYVRKLEGVWDPSKGVK
jgi:uncharacterized damage-inducible protein DinB